MPKTGLLLQRWGRAGSTTSSYPSFTHSGHRSSEFRSCLWLKTWDWTCPPPFGVPKPTNHGLFEVSLLQKLVCFALYSIHWTGRGRSGLVTQGSEHSPVVVLTLFQKIVICTKWNSSTRKQERRAPKLDRHWFLKGSWPNLCSWGQSTKYRDLLEIRVVIFGVQVVGWRENIFRVMGTRDFWIVAGRQGSQTVRRTLWWYWWPKGLSEWYMLVRKLSGQGGY